MTGSTSGGLQVAMHCNLLSFLV